MNYKNCHTLHIVNNLERYILLTRNTRNKIKKFLKELHVREFA